MAAENTVPNEKKQYEVYNGYGKFIYEAESLEEAETYIESITEGANRAAKSGTLVFWTGISIALNVITLIGFTAYSINQYYLGEQEKEEEKVKYNKEFNDLDLSESIEIGKEIIQLIAKELQSGKLDIAKMQELHKLMKDNFYYLARYLFSYYLIAIEFGIPKEKQFYAPRDMVLGKIAKRLDVFYYKPRAVLALNMPQGTR